MTDQIPLVDYLVLGDEPHLEANECAEVARHVLGLLQRSGLGQDEFASRIGIAP